MPRGRTPKASRERWAGAALRALAEGGVSAVSVEPLARKLGVTKGSFYWHFTNREELVEAGLALWEQHGTDRVLAEAQLIADPLDRVKSLFETAFAVRGAGSLIVHLAADAKHPLVAPILERITVRRVKFIAEQFESLGLSPDDAHRRAVLCYSLYIGTFTLHASASAAVPSDAERARYIEHLVQTLVPG
ncbi:MAG: TetR/AcrR family transcriptional regulator [Proteobacteria bacterium]|nr:TetR/AcrR family transcriptional regulator [Pseudomonadota bacterium]